LSHSAANFTYDVFFNEPPPQDNVHLPNGEPKVVLSPASGLIYGREDAVVTDPGMTTDHARGLDRTIALDAWL
jgi:hypothetical protein